MKESWAFSAFNAAVANTAGKEQMYRAGRLNRPLYYVNECEDGT